jgi:hypothetical protein
MPKQKASNSLSGLDKTSPLSEWMVKNEIPVTRANFLDLNFPNGAPDPMPAELEAELPEAVRLPLDQM